MTRNVGFPVAVRNQIRRRLAEWDSSLEYGLAHTKDNSCGDALAKLMGFATFDAMIEVHGTFSVKDQHLHNRLLALLGPHGYALYRAMRAKQNG